MKRKPTPKNSDWSISFWFVVLWPLIVVVPVTNRARQTRTINILSNGPMNALSGSCKNTSGHCVKSLPERSSRESGRVDFNHSVVRFRFDGTSDESGENKGENIKSEIKP
jgi:hypothetical protein